LPFGNYNKLATKLAVLQITFKQPWRLQFFLLLLRFFAALGLAGRLREKSFRDLPLLIGLLMTLAGLHGNTYAQSAANGSALFHGAIYACYSCHSTGYVAGGAPKLPRLNTANVPAVLSHAIQNNAGGYMATYRSAAVDGGGDGASPLSASDRADIAAYIETVAGSGFPVSVSVPYQESTTAIPLKVDATTGRFTSVIYSATA
jgi:cytochrome c553